MVTAMVISRAIVGREDESRRSLRQDEAGAIETRNELIMATTSHQALTRHQNQRTR